MTILNMVYYKVDSGWKPGTNTLAYRPLTASTLGNDESGHPSRNLTSNGATFGTYQGVSCASLVGSVLLYGDMGMKISDYSYTFSIWAYRTGGGGDCNLLFFGTDSGGTRGGVSAIQWRSNKIRFTLWYADLDISNNAGNGAWVNIVCSYNKDTKLMSIYTNGELRGTLTSSYANNLTSTNIVLGQVGSGGISQNFDGYVSNFIVEDKLRTATEVSNYYNSTKSNYGL